MSTRRITLEVFRFDPEKDAAPWFQTYEVDCRDDWVLIDALNHVKETQDPTLNYRWSCHMAVCGSCGMNVNGEPKLGCKTFLRDFPDRVRVEPMANFPVQRDLVTVADDFVAKLARVRPYLIPREEKSIEAGEFRQTPAELARYKQYTLCINCMLCYSACPQYALAPQFIGPAALSLAHRYNLDSRDGGRAEREAEVASGEGVWECSFVGACSEVCPKHVDPASALQQAKIASTVDWFRDHLMPWVKK